MRGDIRIGSLLLDLAHDGAADDDSVRGAGDLGGLLRRGDAEADDDGDARVAFDLGDIFLNALGERGLGACDAFAGDIINEPLACRRQLREAFRGCCRGDKADVAESSALG